jgi:hypothetical protein
MSTYGIMGLFPMNSWPNHCSFTSSDNDLCSDIYKWYDYGPIDRYDIYAPICIVEPDGSYHSSSYVRERKSAISFTYSCYLAYMSDMLTFSPT